MTISFVSLACLFSPPVNPFRLSFTTLAGSIFGDQTATPHDLFLSREERSG
jgi:hypothetical protein